MTRLSTPARLALCLACFTLVVLLLARTLGMWSEDRTAVMRGRANVCESMAILLSLTATQDDTASMQKALDRVAQQNPDVLSLAIRRPDGKIVAKAGASADLGKSGKEERALQPQLSAPIRVEGAVWGFLDARFTAMGPTQWWNAQAEHFARLILFVASFCTVMYYCYLRKVHHELYSQNLIPTRVKLALDNLTEGLVILDCHGKIMLANAAFARMVSDSADLLMGRNVEELPWKPHSLQNHEEPLPWQITLEQGSPRLGALVYFSRGPNSRLTLRVNATPIHDQEGQGRGALVSFDDITQVERSKNELEKNQIELSVMLEHLRQTSDEIRRQNRELEHLATRDPLTSCHNRRSFFEQFNTIWKSAQRHGHPLSCVMLDIDHFKSINDKHGHILGDQVIQQVGQLLIKAARESDIVCRYGGEEFAVLLPYTNLEEAAEAAERFRSGMERTTFSSLRLTASLGVSTLNLGARDPHDLLDQADKCLYVAKRNGRNQVVRWDEVPEDLNLDESQSSEDQSVEEDSQASIPYQAVTALISALAYRDVATAEHSRRVADLCVATGEGLMSLAACYVMENAALLHDIGKIGVPDSILLKPDSLTEEEWQIMRRQQRIGVEIIRASFHSRELVAIIANHQAWYGGTPHDPHLPQGEAIPLGARILSIVNAYDAMTSPQVYRDPRLQEEAFAELRRCAGTQFDPALVERFIDIAKVRQHFPPPNVSRVSQETALQFGLQIEQLMAALDTQDIVGLQALADRLQAMAQKHQVTEIAQKASELASHAQSQHEAAEVLHAANELIELCRSTQSSYVRVADDV